MDVPLARRRRRWPLLLAAVGLLLAVTTLGLGWLADRPPSVARSSVWIDEVHRGQLLREVGGPGSLVPEEIRWITARSDARVERIHAQPGSAVEPDTVLLELDSQDVALKALEAEGALHSAEAALADLTAKLAIERLAQRSTLEGVRNESREARRRAEASQRLAKENMIGALELQRVKERADELEQQLAIEQEHARVLETSVAARIAAQRAEVARLEAQAVHHRDLVASLQVRAGFPGVLQELPLETGQQVKAGELLAKVVEPSRLKAELRIPESRAKELQLGLPAIIDTHNGLVRGRVVRIDPAVQKGSVSVDVALEEALPAGARPDLSVDGRIEIERLDDVLFTGRPAFGQAYGQVMMFKLIDGGAIAQRVPVKLGGSSVSEIEIVEGLVEGDQVILSDMSRWDVVDRVALK